MSYSSRVPTDHLQQLCRFRDQILVFHSLHGLAANLSYYFTSGRVSNDLAQLARKTPSVPRVFYAPDVEV